MAVVIDAAGRARTPLVESFQAVVWHALVSHPELACKHGHWESLDGRAAASEQAGQPRFVDRDGVSTSWSLIPVSGQPESPLRAED